MLHLDLRKLRWGTMALASMLALGAVDARAVTVSFGDSIRYWDGYANGTSDDSRDTIGTPDLRGGTATFDTMGRLQFHVTSQAPHVYRTALSLVTGIPEDKIHVMSPDLGGGCRSGSASAQPGHPVGRGLGGSHAEAGVDGPERATRFRPDRQEIVPGDFHHGSHSSGRRHS